MSRNRLLWLALAVLLSVIVAYQVVVSTSERSALFVAEADIRTAAPADAVASR